MMPPAASFKSECAVAPDLEAAARARVPSRATLALATGTQAGACGTSSSPGPPGGPGLCASTAFSGKLLGFSTLGFPDRPAYSIRGPVHVSTT